MAIPAPKEIQGIPTNQEDSKIVHLPDRDKRLRKDVVGEIQQIPEVSHSFGIEDATPQASVPFPDNTRLRQIRAERTGAVEFPLNEADLKHHAQSLGNMLSNDRGSLAEARTISNKQGRVSLKERASLLKQEELKKAA